MTQMSSFTSFAHRATGVALGLGTLLLTLWLVCAASGDGAYSIIEPILASPFIGLPILFAFTVALFYHFCNGIRHLAWDAGKGFELPTMHNTGRLVFVATAILTLGFWAIGLLVW